MGASSDEFQRALEDRLAGDLAHLFPLFTRYLGMLQQYAPVVGLTGFTGAAELVDEMVVESLRLLETGPISAGTRVVDLGSGNGSPVVPLAITCPEAAFTAVDIRARRVAFLRQVVAALGLENLNVMQVRAEKLAIDEAHSFDLVTSRGFAPPSELLPIALSLVREWGEVRGFLGAAPGTLLEVASKLGLGQVGLVAYEHKTSRRHIYRLQVCPESDATCTENT